MQTILVTGCSGFLGGEIVRQLIARGDRVIGISRTACPDLVAAGMMMVRGDLTDPDFVSAAIAEVDAVIHTAAKAGVWGRWQDYYPINTLATESIIAACQNRGVGRLVYCSSPSVTFGGGHQSGVDESAPYPDNYLNAYSHTKSLAEQAVLAADCHGALRTVALRPHLIFSPADPHLIPRVVERAKLGRLRIVGDGTNRIDTVHVQSAALAHLNALDTLRDQPDIAGGNAYFISQDEPVGCWDWIADLCRLHEVPPPKKKVAFRTAYMVGGILESAYRLTGRRGEPPMTRFVAAQLAHDHYFDIGAAKRDLGYQPTMSMSEAMHELKVHRKMGG